MSSAGPLEGVEALLFDVFGTVVNWEHSITRELQAKSKGVDIGQSELIYNHPSID